MDEQNKENKINKENDGVIDIKPDTVKQITGQELSDAHAEAEDKSNIATVTQSPNFKSGVSGWRLNSNGVIEATGVIITGSVVPDSTITVPQGGTGAVTLTGILQGNGTSAFTAITPLSGTKVYYVADSSGGAVTRKLTFTNGILTAET